LWRWPYWKIIWTFLWAVKPKRYCTRSSCLKQFSKVLYSKVLAELCQTGNMERACSLFDFFPGRGFTPDVVTYTIMIKSYCRMNCLQEAHDLFQDMKSRGIKPVVITYTILLDGKLKQAKLKRHFSSRHRKGKDAPYDVSTIWKWKLFTLFWLMDGHIKVDGFEDAIRLFNEVINRGLYCNIHCFIFGLVKQWAVGTQR